MNETRIERERAVLLVIDMQNDFLQPGAVMEVPRARERLPAMRKLIACCRENGVPVVYTRHVLFEGFDISPIETRKHPQLREAGLRAGTPGVEIVEALRPLPGEPVVDKHRYDAFYNTNLDTVLRNLRGPGVVNTVIICGVVTSVCCESTARSAFMRDYEVRFVDDANAGFDDASHRATLAAIESAFGEVVSTDAVVRAVSAA